jgi:glucokinase
MKYVGIDIGGTNLKAGLIDEFGNILVTRKMKVAGGGGDAESVAWTLVQLTQDLATAGNISLDQIGSVGVGVPGVVEVHSGSIVYTCNLPLRNLPLRKLFHRYLNLPLYVENDANCAALAEYHIGAGRASKRFVTVTLGTGIGAGIIHNGKIYHGSNGMAGEVGHMAIVHDGELCNCGRRGCWERYASATALKRMTQHAAEEHPESILHRVVQENGGQASGQSAFIAQRLGDPVGTAVCDEYISYLGMGLVNIINIFQPDTLAIGGGVSNESDEQLLFPIRKIAVHESIPCNRDKMTRIVKAELGNNAGLIGAALLGKKRDREKMS